MSKLFDCVTSKVFHLKGVSAETVIAAEQKLGVCFSDEFRNYLMEYGVVSFGSHEFMGLGGDMYLDVVGETLNERANNNIFPKNCYLIENLGIDGILILQNEEGEIYELNNAGIKKIFDSFKSYINSLI
ncbi:MAG: SMI1/KNR4 family protein [Eubacteriales bacterium]|nr:SMI1/KNR4 family protein [Eubacteriales bacterium]